MINTSNDKMPDLEGLQSGTCFLIDKPYEWTSFDVVNKIKWVIKKHHGLKKIKVGHAGTLDPLATGLLLVCTGKMTKKIEGIMAEDKVYTGVIKLGFTTPSYDRETEEMAPNTIDQITDSDIFNAMQQFEGEIQQTPPIYSAIKQNGKRLYEYARAGEEVKIKNKIVRVDQFSLKSYDPPFVSFKIVCSKGTYIRSLANDLGQILGCGAYLYELRREKSGEFDVDNAWQIQDVIDGINASKQDQYQI